MNYIQHIRSGSGASGRGLAMSGTSSNPIARGGTSHRRSPLEAPGLAASGPGVFVFRQEARMLGFWLAAAVAALLMIIAHTSDTHAHDRGRFTFDEDGGDA